MSKDILEVNMARNKNTSSSPFGWSQGKYSIQPLVRVPDGTYEEEHGRQGFFGRASHLYHLHPPTGWLRIEGPLKPRAYQVVQLSGEADGQSQVFLKNADVQLGIAKLQSEMKIFARNADLSLSACSALFFASISFCSVIF